MKEREKEKKTERRLNHDSNEENCTQNEKLNEKEEKQHQNKSRLTVYCSSVCVCMLCFVFAIIACSCQFAHLSPESFALFLGRPRQI